MIASTPDLTMRGLDFQNVPCSLVEPAQHRLELPGARFIVIAQDLLTLELRIINPHQAILSEYLGIASEALVDHINLIAALHGGKLRSLNQFADVIDAGVAGGVNFDDVEYGAVVDAGADIALAAGLGGGVGGAEAVEGFGEDAGAGGFAGTAWATKQVGGGDAALF
jgi:hypothetical protein